MTIPGLEANPYPASSARRNGDLPQGLKSAPDGQRLPNPYAHLGFNPVPGNPETVRDLHKKLASCAKVLEQTHGLVAKLMDGSYWTGDAAVAFRDELQGGPLALNLKNAAHSISKAARQLTSWEGELDDFQRRAKRLDEDARDARDTLNRTKAHADKAKSAPDLDKKGSHHHTAQQALTHANTAVENAQSDLEEVINKAKKLASEHEERARRRAEKIRNAAKKLAPQKPGFFESALDWVADNLPDILSWTAGVVGIVALFVLSGGTVAAVLLMIAAALSAGAFMTRLMQPAVWESLKDGFTEGELDADFWSNLIGVTADGLGSLPGVGSVGKGAYAALHSVGEAGEVLTLSQRLATFGSKTASTAREFSDLRNPFTEWVITKAPRLARAVEVTETAAPWVGLGTASYGLSASLLDSLDSDAAASIGTSLDGALLGPIDGAETIDLVRRVFQ
ncbi:hypothetical protein [Streptomyces sp. NPDC058964]|uniref:hypothetical protein n=1 Tax=Streptomyces sp. NPDC058964 TaxID=3346681 RepID=UPI0036C74856